MMLLHCEDQDNASGSLTLQFLKPDKNHKAPGKKTTDIFQRNY